MKTFREVKYSGLRKELVKIECDICHRVTECDWEVGTFDVVDVEVRLKIGCVFPEGGYVEEVNIDLCPKCFKDRLVPWVEGEGGRKIELKEYDV